MKRSVFGLAAAGVALILVSAPYAANRAGAQVNPPLVKSGADDDGFGAQNLSDKELSAELRRQAAELKEQQKELAALRKELELLRRQARSGDTGGVDAVKDKVATARAFADEERARAAELKAMATKRRAMAADKQSAKGADEAAGAVDKERAVLDAMRAELKRKAIEERRAEIASGEVERARAQADKAAAIARRSAALDREKITRDNASRRGSDFADLQSVVDRLVALKASGKVSGADLDTAIAALERARAELQKIKAKAPDKGPEEPKK